MYSCFLHFFFLQLISNLKVFWSEQMLDNISVFLNLPRFALVQHVIYPRECSMCTWKGCIVCFFHMECPINIKFIWSNASLKTCISLLIFCLDHLSNVGRGSENEVTQSCPTLRDLMDCSPPGPSVHGILQARILEWGAISFSRGCSQPRDRTRVSRTAGRSFTVWATREAPHYYFVTVNFSL